ncbi:MATE family efflux transporter [Catenovulum adriaticum]|uniref:MATE family efflux transporter n=1 Tax=Catenovulum adriaticum TaxID=2984846 RepID=A0ABY7AIV6_9ALTE|nr:MATE family efflux transporter [Catenovulum sp. TS8]WAJ69182.1 MATE family efflux transporter [Catenovulum sp. TS8]
MSNFNLVLNGRVIRTYFYYVLPSIIGLLAITSANLIDGIFVGNFIGANALAAITLMIPYFTILIAVAIMLAIGGAVSAGKALGEKNQSVANHIFSQSLIAAAVINLIFALLSLIFEAQLFSLLNIPDEITPLAASYLNVIRWVFIIQLTTMVLYYLVRADNHPLLATCALVTGAVLNIALDAWFIVYLELGLAGAAYATAIAQVIQFLVLSRYFFSKNKTLNFTLMQKNWHLLLRSAYNGVSELISELSVGIIFFILNAVMIARLGVEGVAAFTLVNYFIFLSIMISYGFADALHLVISQNFGAQQFKRVQHFLIVALMSTLTLGLIIGLILLIWPESSIGWFINQEQILVQQVSLQLLFLLLPLFLINGTNIILTCYLTAVHQPKPSAIIAITRSLILPALLLVSFHYFLSHWLILPNINPNLTFIIALPLSEWLAFLLAGYFCWRYRPAKLVSK